MKTLLIDNYDSFTYNLFQLIAAVNGEPPHVIKNDEMSWSEVAKLTFDNIVLSPGPGHPSVAKDFGLCREALLHAKVPILGVCLGHQGLCLMAGGAVIHAPAPMHGRLSDVIHQEDDLFAGLPSPFTVVRYHSFVVSEPLVESLKIIAKTPDGLVMAVRHNEKPHWGVQFHPESIASQYGHELLHNFRNITQAWHASQRYQVVVKKIPSNLDSKQIFLRCFQQSNPLVWLDSSKVDDNARFSIMADISGPNSHAVRYDVTQGITQVEQHGETHVHHLSIFEFLKKQLKHYATKTPELPFQFNLGYIGYLGYELKSETTPVTNRHRSPYPDAQLLFVDRALVLDHQEKTLYLLALTKQTLHNQATQWFTTIETCLAKTPLLPKPLLAQLHHAKFSRERGDYLQDIAHCLTHLRNGESYEICLTNQWGAEGALDPVAYYLHLREINPAPFAALLRFGDLAIACASIERFIRVGTDHVVETKPIKGTLPRGATPDEDAALRKQLAEDEKFRAENLMIVDLLRNDLSKVCEIGSVHVPTLMAVESYQTVHQLVSTVRGKLCKTQNAVEVIKTCFPGGSMTGAPKIRTLEIIDDLETEARGIYSGAIGYFALNGSADCNIVIRTAVITQDKVTIGVGGAIIALSDPLEEFEELLLKASALQNALNTPRN